MGPVALLIGLVLAQDPAEIDRIIAGLSAAEAAGRADARTRAIARWAEWTEADVARFGRVAKLSDEARDAFDRITVRRALGMPVLERLSRAEDVLLGPESGERLKLLAEAGEAWRAGQLSDAELRTLASCAAARWTFEAGVVFPFLRERDLKPLGGIAVALLKDADDGVRVRALETLAWAGAVETAERVAGCLRDDSGRVRLRAVDVLREFKAVDRFGDVEASLADPSPAVREAAERAVTELKQLRNMAPVRAVVLSNRPDAGLRALVELRKLDAPSQLGCCDLMMADSDAEVRAWAVRAVREIGGVERSARFGNRLSDADARVRLVAAETVARTGVAGHDVALERLLRDGEPEVRAAAAEALGWTGGERDAEALGKLFVDPKPAVRRAALEAIARLQGARASKLRWSSVLGDEDADVRAAAALGVSFLDPPLRSGIRVPARREGGGAWAEAAETLARARLDGKADALAGLVDSVLAKPELASLAEPLLATLSEHGDPRTSAILDRPVKLSGKVRTGADLAEALKREGLDLDEADAKALGELPAWVTRDGTTTRRILDRLGRARGRVLLTDGAALRLVPASDGLKAWRARLKK